jgi:hypothetical protein
MQELGYQRVPSGGAGNKKEAGAGVTKKTKKSGAGVSACALRRSW